MMTEITDQMIKPIGNDICFTGIYYKNLNKDAHFDFIYNILRLPLPILFIKPDKLS